MVPYIKEHIVFLVIAQLGGPERRKEEGVLYGDGHYYRKDRKEKVSYNIGTASNVKAPVKPLNHVLTESERSAMGKPISKLNSNDGMALDKPNIGISAQDGKTTGKNGGKVEKERTRLLEQ